MGDVESVDEFLDTLEHYTPVIPDDLTAHFLHRSGFHSPSLHLTRLVSVSAHKFLAEVISDSMQYCKMRGQGGGAGRDWGRGGPRGQQGPGRDRQGRLVLATEDLAAALREYGLNVRKPEYFVDGPLEPPRAVPGARGTPQGTPQGTAFKEGTSLGASSRASTGHVPAPAADAGEGYGI